MSSRAYRVLPLSASSTTAEILALASGEALKTPVDLGLQPGVPLRPGRAAPSVRRWSRGRRRQPHQRAPAGAGRAASRARPPARSARRSPAARPAWRPRATPASAEAVSASAQHQSKKLGPRQGPHRNIRAPPASTLTARIQFPRHGPVRARGGEGPARAAAGRTDAPAHAGRVGRAGAPAGPGQAVAAGPGFAGAAVHHLVGAARNGEDDAGAAAGGRGASPVRGGFGGHGGRQGPARGHRRGGRHGATSRASARCCSSTRSTASTRRSRTRCLPHVEAGTVVLVGATTENPSFEVNAALLSRTKVVRAAGAVAARHPDADRPRARRRGARAGRDAAWSWATTSATSSRARRAATRAGRWRRWRRRRPSRRRTPPGRRRSRRPSSRRPPRRRRCFTTRRATSTTASSASSSRACAAAIRTRPSTGWRACWRRARIRCSCCGGW